MTVSWFLVSRTSSCQPHLLFAQRLLLSNEEEPLYFTDARNKSPTRDILTDVSILDNFAAQVEIELTAFPLKSVSEEVRDEFFPEQPVRGMIWYGVPL